MHWVSAENAEAYLRTAGHVGSGEIVVTELAGGVSNVVLLVTPRDGSSPFVIKQARPQLRVADPWFCSVERIWREIDVLHGCGEALRQNATTDSSEFVAATVPRILFVDRSNYLFAMTAAPPHQVWKQRLLAGHYDEPTAAACGRLLGQLHAATWKQAAWIEPFGDRSFFEPLRIDPYYRHLARQCPALAPVLDQLIRSLEQHPRCLVHGDFSPKNLLVYPGGLMLIDFEVGHYGDPAFDLGFFLSHLTLKSFHAGQNWWNCLRLGFAFWREYERTLAPITGPTEYNDLMRRGLWNWTGCLLARIDGKSKIDYLSEPARDLVRQRTRSLLRSAPATWPEACALLLPDFEANATRSRLI